MPQVPVLHEHDPAPQPPVDEVDPVGRAGSDNLEVRPTHLAEGDDVAHLGRLHPTRIRTVIVQRPVCPRAVIVGGVASKDAHEMALTENDDVVEALSAD